MTLEYVLKKHGLTPGVDVEVLTNVQFALMAGAFLHWWHWRLCNPISTSSLHIRK